MMGELLNRGYQEKTFCREIEALPALHIAPLHLIESPGCS